MDSKEKQRQTEDAANLPPKIKGQLNRVYAAADTGHLSREELLKLKEELYEMTGIINRSIGAVNVNLEIADATETRAYRRTPKKTAQAA